jgi:hypothetical protein
MDIKINSWIERLGNNIIQMRNIIQIALYYKLNIRYIIFPKHPYFNTERIVINKSIHRINRVFTDKNNFYYQNEIKFIDKGLFNYNKDITLNILKSIFKISNVVKLKDDEVLIHIRSGDIFDNKPHQEYVMPPLSYYTNILNNNNFSKIYLIAEDRKNPVINKLLELYSNISFEMGNLNKDIRLLLGSSNVIVSFGTFTSTLLTLSDNIKNIYKPSYQCAFMISRNQVNIFDYDLEEYKIKLTPWQNTKEQREIMMNYSGEIRLK